MNRVEPLEPFLWELSDDELTRKIEDAYRKKFPEKPQEEARTQTWWVRIRCYGNIHPGMRIMLEHCLCCGRDHDATVVAVRGEMIDVESAYLCEFSRSTMNISSALPQGRLFHLIAPDPAGRAYRDVFGVIVGYMFVQNNRLEEDAYSTKLIS